MNGTDESILQTVLALPPASRAELAELLWASLPDETNEAPLDNEIRAAWAKEAHQRLAEIESGQLALIDGEDVLRRLKARCK